VDAERPIRWGFVAAWVFLVAVVALAFYIQARTIERLERDEQTVATAADQTAAQQTENAEILCGLLVRIAQDDKALVVATFRDLGYRCEVPTALGG